MPWSQQRLPPDTNLSQHPQTTVQSPLHNYQQQQIHSSQLNVDGVFNNYKNVNTQWSNYNKSVEQTSQISGPTTFVQQQNLTSNNTVNWSEGSVAPATNYFSDPHQAIENNLQQNSLHPQQSTPPLYQYQDPNSNQLIPGSANLINAKQSIQNLVFKTDRFNNGQATNDWDDWSDWNENNLSTNLGVVQYPLQKQTTNLIEDSFKTESIDNWQYGNTSSNELSKIHSELPNKIVERNLKQINPINLTTETLTSEGSNLIPNTNKIETGSTNMKPATSNLPTLMGISSVPDTISSGNISIDSMPQTKPVAYQSREMANLVTAEKISQSLPQQVLPSSSSNLSFSSGNPFKYNGPSQQIRTIGTTQVIQQNCTPFLASPPPEDFANPPTEGQELLKFENLEIVGQQNNNQNNVTPNKDRNQYLKTSHLSEEGLSRNYEAVRDQELNNELDKFPPPGLSRLVLGQPESTQHPPHGLDRMIPGTELDSDLNLARQADGQDTVPKLRSAFANVGSVDGCNNNALSKIDFTTDRNLYQVPGDSGVNELPQMRVVTGLENHSPGATVLVNTKQTGLVSVVQSEQREVELDGENLEDEPNVVVLEEHQQQRQQEHYQQNEDNHQQQEQLRLHQSTALPLHQQINQTENIESVMSSRSEPIEGSNITDGPPFVKQNQNFTSNPVLSVGSKNLKDFSNNSTENDESDQDQFKRHSNYLLKTNRLDKEEKKRIIKITNEQRDEHRYDSEESDLSSERDNRKYRENCMRTDLYKDRESKDRNRLDNVNVSDKAEGDSRRKERFQGENDRFDRNSDYRGREKVEKSRVNRSNRYNSNSKYDADSKYETEESIKNERRIRSDRERYRDRKRDGENDRYNDHRRDSEKDRQYYQKSRRDDHDGRDGRDGRDDRDRDRDRDRGSRRGYRDRDYEDDREIRRSMRKKKPNDYEDNYRKTSSRNARESDFERERKDSRYSTTQVYGGYQTNSYGYDPYTLYQHQQYYEHLRRTNPQAYAEWYRKYYGQIHQDSLGAGGRDSVHSGRSSANNDKNRYSGQQHHHQYIPHHLPQSNISINLNSTMIDQQQFVSSGVVSGTYGLSHGQSTGNLSQIGQMSSGYYGGTSGKSYYARSEHSETRTDNMSLNLIDSNIVGPSSIPEAVRLTPCKFNNSHTIVSLSAGLLVCVKPKFSTNDTANVVKILQLTPDDSSRRLFQTFPGPLIHGLTHKKTAIEFCEEQIKLGPCLNTMRTPQNSMNSLCSSVSQTYKASYCLMWNLLILLLRQNGVVVGTDIAELLMKNKSAFPYEALISAVGSRRESQNSNQYIEKEKVIGGSDTDFETTPSINLNKGSKNDLEEQKTVTVTSQLNEQQITEKFRNYLLYGNVNEALEWATDNNLWGHALFLASKVDRRSHANVMMKFANKLSLNDPLQTLYQLMSGRTPSSVTSIQDEKWGDWRPHLAMILSNTSQKPELDRKSITTLGDSLYNRGDIFGAHFCYLMAQVGFGKYSNGNQEGTSWLANSPNAVRLVLLGSSHQKSFREFATNEAIMMTEIYEYACSLNDDKFSLNLFQPYKYLMATRMLDYGNHLRCLMYMEQISMHIQRDPTKYEQSFIEKVHQMADRLKYYEPVLEKNVEDQEIFDNNMTVSNQKWIQNLYGIIKEHNAISTDFNQEIQPPGELMADPTLNSEINNQFSEINRQFNELNLQYTNFNPSQPTGVQQLVSEISSENQSIGIQENVPQIGQNYNSENYYQQNSVSNQFQQQMTGTSSGSLVSNNFMHQHGNVGQEVLNETNYEYMTGDQQWQQPLSVNDERQKQQITLPNSKIGYDDSGKNDASSVTTRVTQKSDSLKKKADSKHQSGIGNPNLKQSGSGGGNNDSGWFGGIWNKLSMKPKNQMILPDDKNPSIVWDQENKCWVNTEGVDEAQESFKPPPKMSKVMQNPNSNYEQLSSFPLQTQQEQIKSIPSNQNYGASMGASNTLTTIPGGEIKTPSLQSNKFKMQRNRTLKNSYVDVFNPPGAQPSKLVEPVLAPTLTSTTVPQGGFFIPSAPNNDAPQTQHQQQDSAVPQFYNPNRYG